MRAPILGLLLVTAPALAAVTDGGVNVATGPVLNCFAVHSDHPSGKACIVPLQLDTCISEAVARGLISHDEINDQVAFWQSAEGHKLAPCPYGDTVSPMDILDPKPVTLTPRQQHVAKSAALCAELAGQRTLKVFLRNERQYAKNRGFLISGRIAGANAALDDGENTLKEMRTSFKASGVKPLPCSDKKVRRVVACIDECSDEESAEIKALASEVTK